MSIDEQHVGEVLMAASENEKASMVRSCTVVGDVIVNPGSAVGKLSIHQRSYLGGL